MGLVKLGSNALLNFELNSIEVFQEMKGAMSEALKQNLLLS